MESVKMIRLSQLITTVLVSLDTLTAQLLYIGNVCHSLW